MLDRDSTKSTFLKGYNMSNAAIGKNQKNVVIGLIAVIVLLAAIVFLLIWQNNKAADTANTQTPAQGQVQEASSAMQNAIANAGEFDAATAQKIPAGSTPEAWVKGYYDACDKADWKAAWDHLPTAKREVTTAEALAAQLQGYGITGYKIIETKDVSETEQQISVEQMTGSYGNFTSIWTFVKDGDNWLVKNKAVEGMQ